MMSSQLIKQGRQRGCLYDPYDVKTSMYQRDYVNISFLRSILSSTAQVQIELFKLE